jgi:hypothetical protein
VKASPIDECLSIRGEHLFVEACDAVELASRFGTPLYVMSEDQLRRNARRFQDAFGSRWPEGPVNVLPSIKANFSLALRRILTQEGMGCDTFGPGELEAALRCGVDPMLISVNGTAKDEHLIDHAVGAGARITLDSVREIELVRAVARRRGVRATVRFRVRPDYAELTQPSEFVEEDVPIRTFAQTYKPGIPTADLLAGGITTTPRSGAGWSAASRQRSASSRTRGRAGGRARSIWEVGSRARAIRPGEVCIAGPPVPSAVRRRTTTRRR